MKRILAASVNAFSILLVLAGIITLALNSEQSGILASLSHPDYLDSPVFETQVSEWSLERGQDGNVCYEFELVDNGGNEKEVKIDAVIGKIVSVK